MRLRDSTQLSPRTVGLSLVLAAVLLAGTVIGIGLLLSMLVDEARGVLRVEAAGRTVLLPGGRVLAAARVSAVSAAVLVATNPWDVFILTGALGLATLVAVRGPAAGLVRLVGAGAVPDRGGGHRHQQAPLARCPVEGAAPPGPPPGTARWWRPAPDDRAIRSVTRR